MARPAYSLSNAAEGERERLATMQRLYDPGTFRAFEACGAGPGWRCLEVGGGVGSVATWLADRVGPGGHVVATDLDTRWLDELARDNVTVRRHDVVTEPVEGGPFDLVHVRLLLEHLPQRAEVLAKLVAALKPGGWLVAEDLDWITAVSEPAWPEYDAVRDAVHAAMASFGYDKACGRNLPRMFEDAGLTGIHLSFGAEGDRDTARNAWLPLVSQFRGRLVEAGLVTDEVLDAFAGRLGGRDDWSLLPPVMVTVRGSRP